MEIKPLKRHTALRPLSHDHHQALLLCWKIRKGLASGIDPARMEAYAKWMFLNHLEPHFKVEEECVFTVLPPGNEDITRALDEHRELRLLFSGKTDDPEILNQISRKLEDHIRFEERELFEKIQQAASPSQLETIERAHATPDCELWHDEFWT